MPRHTLQMIPWALAAVFAVASPTLAEPPKHARPPKFPSDVQNVFFDDARKELKGDRPDYNHSATKPPASPASASGISGDSATATFAWSALIDAETIEFEIKRTSALVDKDVTTPTEFKGGSYKLCRRGFSFLAVLFAVTGQFDADARWKDIAPGLREIFARAGYNCKAASDQTYNEARQRKQDLADLIHGSRPQLPKADAIVDWAHVADRPPLMQRLNIAQQERLTKWLADPNEFKRHQKDAKHEAQLVAMIAEVITRNGFDDVDDSQYLGFAHELRDAATAAAAATEKNDFDAAHQAINRASKACTACHEAFRG
jgi:hypothetical protein